MFKKRQLRLNNLHNMRSSISALVREFYRNPENMAEDNTWWRTLSGFLRLLVEAGRAELDQELEQRVTKIEKILEERYQK